MVLARPSIDGEQARDLTHALELRLDDLLTRQLLAELVQREGGSHQHQQPPVTNARSIQLLLECLQCLWSHADTKRRLQAFSHLGSYLPWFLRAWNSYPHDVDIPRIVAQILQLWSSTKNATINAELLRSGVVDRFRQAMAWEIPSCHPVHAFILTTLKNLTLRATEGDNIRMHTDLYDLVVRHAVDEHQTATNNDVERVLHILWNWAALPKLAPLLASDRKLWHLLHWTASIPISADSIVLHRHAASVLGCVLASQSLSAPMTPSSLLLQQQDWLSGYLFTILELETDADLRRRCARLVRCLAGSEQGQALIQKGMPSEDSLTVLVQVVRNPRDAADTRCQACQALTKFLSGTRLDWASMGPCLETILTQTIEHTETPDKLVLLICEALLTCFSQSQWKRGPNFPNGFLERLLSVLQENVLDPKFHDTMSTLLLHKIEHSVSSRSETTPFVNRHVLDMAALFLTPTGPEYVTSQSNAIHMISALLRDPNCKRPLADNERLLSSLVSFCLVTRGPAKDEAKLIILQLVPEL